MAPFSHMTKPHLSPVGRQTGRGLAGSHKGVLQKAANPVRVSERGTSDANVPAQSLLQQVGVVS